MINPVFTPPSRVFASDIRLKIDKWKLICYADCVASSTDVRGDIPKVGFELELMSAGKYI